jgi:hypothetical protein
LSEMLSPAIYAEGEAIFDRLQTDEVIQRWSRKMDKGARRPVTVLDFLGEQRVVALLLLMQQFEVRRVPYPAGPLKQMQTALGVALMRTPAFLWTHEMRNLAGSYNVPRHVIGASAFPHEAMWWTFESSVAAHEMDVDGLLIFRLSWLHRELGWPMTDDGWAMFAVGSHDSDAPISDLRAHKPILTALWTVRDGTDTESVGTGTQYLVMAAFLNSHSVAVTRRRPSDDLRRWRGRHIGDPASLNVITLRSSVREAVASERGEGPQWKQRWLVRGHLRAQWYPSTRSHQVIWVAPYLKGPEGAPLKVPVYRVAR